MTYCDRLGRQRGTELWAAYLTDPRFDAVFRAELAAKPADDEPRRPALAGYDQVAEGLLGVRRELAVLIRAVANKPTYPLPQGPVFPAERFEIQDDHAEANRLEASVAAGLQRGKERHIG